jgi:hypothetical protein
VEKLRLRRAPVDPIQGNSCAPRRARSPGACTEQWEAIFDEALRGPHTHGAQAPRISGAKQAGDDAIAISATLADLVERDYVDLADGLGV